MYFKKNLLSNQKYALINNNSLINTEVKIKQEKYELILSAVEENSKLISPYYGTFSNIRINTTNINMIQKLVKKNNKISLKTGFGIRLIQYRQSL